MVQLLLYFGNAEVVFQDCNIYLQLPLHGQYNVLSLRKVEQTHNKLLGLQYIIVTLG